MHIPTVSVEQMREVDGAVPQEYGVTVSRMMENAGYQIADFVRQHLDADTVHVYTGTGNNGGDGLAAARRLHLWGYDVAVVAVSRDLDGIRQEELDILEALGVPVQDRAGGAADVVIDALIGYNLDGAPRSPFDHLIEEINAAAATAVSVDVPSGVDADTGEEMQPYVTADHTVTLALPFDGLRETDAAGEIWAADISVPPQVYDRFGIDANDVFSDASLTRYR
ncbi:MAG: NAD(P)H-hydrate epimerase [Candidatus Nanohaloarchaea archaeon]|nr:NAD(P)H-hydrate epimerase [Candidatus Nanohaloarchaea archaeon]